MGLRERARIENARDVERRDIIVGQVSRFDADIARLTKLKDEYAIFRSGLISIQEEILNSIVGNILQTSRGHFNNGLTRDGVRRDKLEGAPFTFEMLIERIENTAINSLGQLIKDVEIRERALSDEIGAIRSGIAELNTELRRIDARINVRNTIIR